MSPFIYILTNLKQLEAGQGQQHMENSNLKLAKAQQGYAGPRLTSQKDAYWQTAGVIHESSIHAFDGTKHMSMKPLSTAARYFT